MMAKSPCDSLHRLQGQLINGRATAVRTYQRVDGVVKWCDATVAGLVMVLCPLRIISINFNAYLI